MDPFRGSIGCTANHGLPAAGVGERKARGTMNGLDWIAQIIWRPVF